MPVWLSVSVALLLGPGARAQQPGGTRLLRQPTLSATSVAFEYGGDNWVASRAGGDARRLTATPAIETDPHFSPDGRWVAFTSNRSGMPQVWVIGAEGGEPRRLTWYPSPSFARGWTPDGKDVLYASDRGSAPVPYAHLWLVPADGGAPHAGGQDGDAAAKRNGHWAGRPCGRRVWTPPCGSAGRRHPRTCWAEVFG